MRSLLKNTRSVFQFAGLLLGTCNAVMAAAPGTTCVVLVGDSTVAPNGGWGPAFSRYLPESVTCTNFAQAGRSSKSYLAEGHWEKALAVKGDYYLIQFGHNDQPGKGPDRETDPATTYQTNLARFVDEARAVGGTPVLITSLTRRNFSTNTPAHIESTLTPYAEAVKKLAAEKQVALIDLHTRSIALCDAMGPKATAKLNPMKEGKPDRTHLGPEGAEVFARLVVEDLRPIAPALALLAEPRKVIANEVAATASPAVTPPAQAAKRVRWSRALLERQSEWYASAEASAIADNVIQYQSPQGGWPKNTDIAAPASAAKFAASHTSDRANTIDNNGTTLPMQFLALMVQATGDARCRTAFERGMDYLFAAQYSNGGWPQFYPLRDHGYYSHITYNDNAMMNVMFLLRDVAAGKAPYGFVSEERRAKAAASVAKGTECILRTQIQTDGQLTAWCAQHDEHTLKPTWARNYEPPTLSGDESVPITRFLMQIEEPTPQVIAAVEGAMGWFKTVAIPGMRYQRGITEDGERDGWVKADPKAGPLWARFYEIGSNRAVFIGRDKEFHYSYNEIERERRGGYDYYGDWPERLLSEDFPKWRAKHKLTTSTR